jgi:hypothetical protein
MAKSKLTDPKIPDQVMLDIQYFFLNFPEAKVRENLYQLFSGWVFSISETGSAKEVNEMMVFYEELTELITSMARLTPKDKSKSQLSV